MSKLILFDIDGTLVLTGGAGRRAAARAFANLFPIDGFENPLMEGRTDYWIFTELAKGHGLVPDAATLERIRDAYLVHLAREIHEPAPDKGILPGVRSLLDLLSARDDVTLAILTGNTEQGARIKLDYFDLWRYFGCGGFGGRALERTALFADAIASVAARCGTVYQPEAAVIVGDTPLDIAVGIATGARSVGVATGSYDVDALRVAGADAVLPDLTAVPAALSALGLTMAL